MSPNQALNYADSIHALLQRIQATQMEKIHEAAFVLAETIAQDGIIYTFGTGHSHLIAEDVVFRAGGLVPIDAILEPSLTGHTQVQKSETMERVEGIAEVIINYYNIQAKDALIIISNSGRNAAPIEMAKIGHERGCRVIAVTSLSHSQGTTSRHSSGKKLFDYADVVIDNQAPKGDTIMQLDGMDAPIGACSGVTGLFIMQMMMVATCQILLEKGIQPQVFLSGNLDSTEIYNESIMKKYLGRIKIW
ncbi:MAG TPA: SIS domain-containing protein [Anaerolineaceae bacterium]|nr:SIS domain-containing protein [Anaerolineaceae bacterium]